MKTVRLKPLLVCIAVFVAALNLCAAPVEPPRERLLMDFGWRFHLGNEWGSGMNLVKAGYSMGPANPAFSDASWRTVNLPHDWANELPFDELAETWHGFKPVGPGFPGNSEGWYRRTFVLPKADAGKRLWLEFDGVYRNCTVFLNGWYVGRHVSGYGSFRFDVTDVAEVGGTNLLAVHVDAGEFEGWFYEGAGIYRHVWLVKTAPLAVAPDGTFVFSRFKNNVPEGSATVHVQTHLLNSQKEPTNAVVNCEIRTADGKSVGRTRKTVKLAGWGDTEIEQTMRVKSPALWSPETPNLYKLVTTIESGGKTIDRTETEFGIRTVAFDKDKGFILNGRPYVIEGTCNHENHAGVGNAVPDRLGYYRVEKLKEMGANAFRIAHHPPAPELIEACDRLGMLFLDENRLLGCEPENLAALEAMVRRDRNHPSIFAWSLGNEEWVQTKMVSRSVGETMQRLVRKVDPTRPVTYASHTGEEPGINQIMEVRGWNYTLKNIDTYRRMNPDQPNLGTEQSSVTATRGIYTNDDKRGYVSAYDVNYPGWGSSAERWWTFFVERPWLSGGFVWTGFDYRGEQIPYGWPCINSHFGLMDMCGFPKDNYYYYQAWWGDKPVLHLFPHWNWPGREGGEIDVRVFSNCEEVELFLNDQSLGRQTMKKNSHCRWNVKYASGTLSAKGYTGGKVIAETKVETTGEPAVVTLEPDRANISADGEDVSVVNLAVRDAQGRVVPTATNLVRFTLSGPGKIIGVGNGDPSCHEPDVVIPDVPMRLITLEDWRWKLGADARKSGIPEYDEQFDDSAWDKVDVESERGPLDGDVRAVFRTQVSLTDEDLQSPVIEIRLNSVDDWCWVYVNGRKAGETRDTGVPVIFDIKQYLHSGTNAIAVGVMNIRGPGGINKGVTLQLQGEPAPVEWSRSAFNGFAQVIVQSSKQAGELKLTAAADGLTSAVTVIQTKPCVPQPAME